MSVARKTSRAGERRLLAITAVAIAAAIAYVSLQSLQSAAVYYYTPTEAKQRSVTPGATTRLGGQVEPRSLSYDQTARDLRFILSDGVTRVFVIGRGAPPALLREGAGAIVEGFFAADGTFHATQVIAKHDEVYVPPSPSAVPAHKTP